MYSVKRYALAPVGLFIYLSIFLTSHSVNAGTQPSLALWSEFLPYAQVEQQLPELAARHLSLYLAVSENHTDWEGLEHLLKAAIRHQVEVRPWLLLSEAHGYWFNKWNLKESESFVWHFLDEMAKRGLKIEWLIFDVEPPAALMTEIDQKLRAHQYFSGYRQLKKSGESASLLRAERMYTELVQKLHLKNVRVQAVVPNFVLDDRRDGAQRIQNSFGTPVENVPWDEITFMVYRLELQKIIGPVSSDIVFRYATLAHDTYGAASGVDLGEVGIVRYPQLSMGYTREIDLQSDYLATLRAGIERIHFYSLDGMLGGASDSKDAQTTVSGISGWMASLGSLTSSTARSPGLGQETGWSLKAMLWMNLMRLGRLSLPVAQ